MTAPTPPSPEKRALIDAYKSALQADADRRDAAPAAPLGPRRARPAAWIALVLALAAGAVVVVRPAWLGLGQRLEAPPAVREASLRLAVALEAQRVARYQRDYGRLPATLDAAGPIIPGIAYQPSREGVYELAAADGDIAVVYRSTGSLRAFVGRSYEVVSGRGQ